MKNNSLKIKGFTLIEIMVSMSIFMIVMLVSLGALITFSDTAKKAQALRSVMDNVNFAMESMTRSLRMGTDYTCITSETTVLPALATPDCPLSGNGGNAIVFTPATKPSGTRDTAYFRKSRQDGTHTLEQCDVSSCSELVSPDVDIQQLSFFVNGSLPSDNIQPSVYILMKGIVRVKGVPTTFTIQTMASQRSVE